MHILEPMLFASFLTFVAATNIRFYENPEHCTGGGVICVNLSNGTCCADPRPDRFYGSARAESDRHTDQVVAFTSDPDRGSCGRHFGKPEPAVFRVQKCMLTSDLYFESPITGAIWQYSGGFKDTAGPLGACENAVMGDEMFTDGAKTWVISNGKMDGMTAGGVDMPTADADKLEFFKTHADTILDDDEVQSADVQVTEHVQLPAPITSGSNAAKDGAERDSMPSILRRGPNFLQELFKRGECVCSPSYGPKGDGSPCTCPKEKDSRRAKRFVRSV